MDINQDFTTFVYGGGSSNTVYVYSLINGTYEVVFSEYIGSVAQAARMTDDALYFLISAENKNVYTYYRCP